MPEPIVETHQLTKSYGDLVAVNRISFAIEEGEIFGLLGPNGAGKSTTINMLTGLFPPTEGSARVAGHDIVHEPAAVKTLIGVVPQELALYDELNARDNIRFFGELYGLKGAHLKQRVEEVLRYVAMTERAGAPIHTYSGGMKRRVNLAVGLVHNPRVLFLDEPTVGVDPQSRNHIFESVERLNREQGMTILYTTHYMEEAERLCHRVGIIDHGEIIALDTPRNLIGMLGGGIIQIGLAHEAEGIREQVEALPAIRTATFLPEPDTTDDMEAGSRVSTLKVETRELRTALLQIIELFNTQDMQMLSLETLEPSLESVFLHLTGKTLRQ